MGALPAAAAATDTLMRESGTLSFIAVSVHMTHECHFGCGVRVSHTAEHEAQLNILIFKQTKPHGCCCPPIPVCSYEYDGDATCAADGMCQEKCPVKINTGEQQRGAGEGEGGGGIAPRDTQHGTQYGTALHGMACAVCEVTSAVGELDSPTAHGMVALLHAFEGYLGDDRRGEVLVHK